MFLLEKLRRVLLSETRTMTCPKCGGTMYNHNGFPPDPYWDVIFECENCGVVFDGCVVRKGDNFEG